MAQKQISNLFQAQSNAIASYNYVDIAEGTGVVLFYGADSVDNAVKSYLLTNNAVYSNDKLTIHQRAAGSIDNAIELDLDFDVIFNMPKDLKGTVKCSVTWLSGHDTTPNLQGVSYIVLKVRKWDGTTETEIAANTASDTLTTASLVADSKTALIEVDVPTAQHFKKGETLRLTIELWSTAGSGGTRCAVLHDPMDRTVTCEGDYIGGAAFLHDPDTSQLKFYVPFVLEI